MCYRFQHGCDRHEPCSDAHAHTPGSYGPGCPQVFLMAGLGQGADNHRTFRWPVVNNRVCFLALNLPDNFDSTETFEPDCEQFQQVRRCARWPGQNMPDKAEQGFAP